MTRESRLGVSPVHRAWIAIGRPFRAGWMGLPPGTRPFQCSFAEYFVRAAVSTFVEAGAATLPSRISLGVTSFP